MTKGLKQFELQKLQEIDTLVSITNRDLLQFRELGFHGNAHVTPIGLELNQYETDWSSYEEPLSLSFIGSLDWLPNLEGIEWFIDNVIPQLIEQFPNLKLHIAGRNMPSDFLQKNNTAIIIHGEVENAHDFIKGHTIMIVPLFSGSGMRVKILEGMALNRVILTTTIGVEGINAKHGEHLMIVDTAEDFIVHIKKCIQQSNILKVIGQNARQFIEQYYDNLQIAQRLKQHYNELRVNNSCNS